MMKRIFFLMILAALLLSACGSAAPAPGPAPGAYEAEGMGGEGAGAGVSTVPELGYGNAGAGVSAAPELGLRDGNAATTERLVIKKATLTLVVKDPAASVDSISALADSLGGFVVDSSVYLASTDAAGNKIMRAQISIRVPADKFLQTLEQLEAMAVTGKADSKNITGEDVTAEYTDLESRLRNLEAAEEQLQQIMDSATKTEDVLAVYNQLVYIREQIEQVKGQMKYYRESAAMSLISINLEPDVLSQPIEVGGWRPQGVAKEAIETLVSTLQSVAGAAIWFGLFCLPLMVLFGIPGYFAVRYGMRQFRKPKPAASA